MSDTLFYVKQETNDICECIFHSRFFCSRSCMRAAIDRNEISKKDVDYFISGLAITEKARARIIAIHKKFNN